MTSKRLTSGGASLAALLLAVAGFGCDNGDERIDAGTDAGPIPMVDSGPDIDGGPIPMVDGGPATDAGTDAGEVDAGPPPGGGAATSTQIAAVRDAADATDLELPIDGALVTYVKASVGSDPAGFFVQAERGGPAIFVRLDPGVLTPSPERGQVVDFEVNELETAQGRREVTAIDGWTVESTGHDINFLVEDITTLDLVAELDRLEATLVEVDLQVVGSFGDSGAGHQAADVVTEGTSTGARLRLSNPVEAALTFAHRCLYRVGPTPMWRFDAVPQISAYAVAEVADGECLPPQVLGAGPFDETSVLVCLDRAVDGASLEADGSQFTIETEAGETLAVTAASLEGECARLTTAAHADGTTYTVTVADTVTDTGARGVDPAANTATFEGGYEAGLVINEVLYHSDGGGSQRGEFIEIYNPTGSAVDLSDLRVLLVDGRSDPPTVRRNFALAPATEIAAGGYLLLINGTTGTGSSTVTVPEGVPTVLMGATGELVDSGSHGVVLFDDDSESVVDSMAYNSVPADFEFEGETYSIAGNAGTAPRVPPDSFSLSRIPNGWNTGEPSVNFRRTAPTPGLAN